MTDTTARMRRSDGRLVRVHPDGREEVMVKRPVRAMTDAQITAAAVTDPDAQPLTPELLANMRRLPPTRRLRRELGLSQEEFALRYHIPVGTLRDWEQGRFEPDAAARAYLAVIAREPETVRRALAMTPRGQEMPQPSASQ